MAFKKWAKNIQAAAYNGARTVYKNSKILIPREKEKKNCR